MADVLLPDNNFKPYPRKPKLSDATILALTLTAEALSIDKELTFWSKLKQPDSKIEGLELTVVSNYNRRKKALLPYFQLLQKRLATVLNEGETQFIVDSMPLPICKPSRAKRITICQKNAATAPSKGYSASVKLYYMGYKLNITISAKGVVHSIQITKGSVHDVNYLSKSENIGLKNCTLIGDKGYISATIQADLFNNYRIELRTPFRKNQKNKEPFPKQLAKARKRIETLFSQLCGQFLIKRNYAKQFEGFFVRIVSKIVTVTALQYFNHLANRPLNHLQYALAS